MDIAQDDTRLSDSGRETGEGCGHKWALKLLRRIIALPPGHRYSITLSVDARACDWTVQDLGKIERAN